MFKLNVFIEMITHGNFSCQLNSYSSVASQFQNIHNSLPGLCISGGLSKFHNLQLQSTQIRNYVVLTLPAGQVDTYVQHGAMQLIPGAINITRERIQIVFTDFQLTTKVIPTSFNMQYNQLLDSCPYFQQSRESFPYILSKANS